MTKTIVEQLADFTTLSDFGELPSAVVEECKRLVLDSIGCALAGTEHPKGKIGIEYGRLMGAGSGKATIIGTGEQVSIFGAAFANGELINALDFDAVMPPGHVTPYVLPGALAIAESTGASGKDLITAMALSHEMSFRIGKSMDYLRDTKDGKVSPPKVYGYSSVIFGATAAIARMKRLSTDIVSNALGIAGITAPVNAHWAWVQHAPSTTLKYLTAGSMTQTAMTAAHMAELGHRGDVRVLDDREYGFPSFIGTTRWEPAPITDKLGIEWRFPAESTFKPYPHCRILHALLDTLIEVVEQNDIKPDEIDGIKVSIEGFTEQPIWLNNEIEHVTDAQFSMAHGIALGAHRLPPGKAWQDPKTVFSPSVLGLMKKVTLEVHPDYVKHLTNHPASRPARVELKARGKTFVGERLYPKGSPSPDPASTMTTEELVLKFRHNADGMVAPARLDSVVDALLNLDKVGDIASLMRQMDLPSR
jgi:2-methylcitrate dehydratase PrpD